MSYSLGTNASLKSWTSCGNGLSRPLRTKLGQCSRQGILLELVTELVSRHLVGACYRVLSDLPTTSKPRF